MEDDAREETARMLYESETGKKWSGATEEERKRWLEEAQLFRDIIHAPIWPKDE